MHTTHPQQFISGQFPALDHSRGCRGINVGFCSFPFNITYNSSCGWSRQCLPTIEPRARATMSETVLHLLVVCLRLLRGWLCRHRPWQPARQRWAKYVAFWYKLSFEEGIKRLLCNHSAVVRASSCHEASESVPLRLQPGRVLVRTWCPIPGLFIKRSNWQPVPQRWASSYVFLNWRMNEAYYSIFCAYCVVSCLQRIVQLERFRPLSCMYLSYSHACQKAVHGLQITNCSLFCLCWSRASCRRKIVLTT